MKLTNEGKLHCPAKISFDEAALRFVADQQARIDSYERSIDNILLSLLDYDSLSIKHSDDHRIEHIHQIILDYKKALLETESGREFLAKYDINLFKSKEPK